MYIHRVSLTCIDFIFNNWCCQVVVPVCMEFGILFLVVKGLDTSPIFVMFEVKNIIATKLQIKDWQTLSSVVYILAAVVTVSIDSQFPDCLLVSRDGYVTYSLRQSEWLSSNVSIISQEDCNVSRPRIPSRLAYSGGQEVSGAIHGEISHGRKNSSGKVHPKWCQGSSGKQPNMSEVM